jgi:hypothetical protein
MEEEGLCLLSRLIYAKSFVFGFPGDICLGLIELHDVFESTAGESREVLN